MALLVPICLLLLAVSTVLSAAPASKPSGPPGPGGPPPFPREPPPEFKDVLPPETFSQLTTIHQDDSLTPQQKEAKINAIMDALPQDILKKLPLPPIFRELPQDIQERLKAIHSAKDLTMKEKNDKIRNVLDSLPEQHQLLFLGPPQPLRFPPGPPSELKDVLPKETWDELVAVHQDNTMNTVQKMQKIGEILDALPDSTRQKFPLPPPFRNLPADVKDRLRAVQIQRGLTFEQRIKKTHEIIESLPPDVKKLVPPPPPGLLPPPKRI